MIRSMTGFGSAQVEGEMGTFTLELKSVNNRFLDFSFRMPGTLSRLEREMRDLIGAGVRRGRVEVSVRWIPKGEMLATAELNQPLVEKIYREAQALAERIGAVPDIRIGELLNIPNAFIETPPVVDEKRLWKEVRKGLRKALAMLQRAREREGERLRRELGGILEDLDLQRRMVAERKDAVLEKFRQRLLKKIEEFREMESVSVEPARMEAEVLLYADRSDITEELARMESHIAGFRDQLASESEEPAGRSFEFLTQELLREVNTIGSKSHDTELANCVLAMKNSLEKLREQIQNIE